jgi:hypothetical protein
MNRARFALAATLVAATLVSGTAFAQAPPMTQVLAGKKFTPPLRGMAEIQYTKPTAKRDKEIVVSTIYVKNMSKAPVARLTVNETWYDGTGAVVTGGKGVVLLLQPGEVQEMHIESTVNPKMKTNTWAFSHANGGVTPVAVEKDKMEGIPAEALDAKKAPAAKAPAAKAPAAKAPAAKK